MHTSFIDKKRRNLNLREMQVKNVLPEHFAEYYPKFIELLERYYEFQDQDDSTELIKHLFASRDINETDITLLEYIEDELLLGKAYFKGFGSNETELRAAANFSNTMFRSKGTRFAIEWFFRSFYGEDVEVLYPKENIFLVGVEDSRIGADSLRYLTDDKLYQTFALLIRVGISISKWKEVFKLFVHPAGMYLGGEVLLVDDVEANIVTLNDVIDQYTTPTYEIQAASASVEGGLASGYTMSVVVQGTNVRNDGTDVVYWWGEHIDTTDSDFTSEGPLYDSDNKQYLEINRSAGSFYLGFTIEPESDPLEGDETFKLYIEDRSGRLLDEKTITIIDVVPNWSITRTPSGAVDEGTEIEFTVTGINPEYRGNSELYWYLDTVASTASSADFEGTIPTQADPELIDISVVTVGSGILYPRAEGTFSATVKVDALSDDLETAVFKIINANGIVVATEEITLTQVAPTLSVSVDNITEGDDIVANVTADVDDIGKEITWQISGSDSRIPIKSGSFTVASTSETVTVSTTTDADYQGDQTYSFTLTDATIGYSPSDTFVISDEAPVYTLTADPAVGIQGDTVTYSVGGTNIPDGSVWFYIANAPSNPTNDADWTPAPPRDGSRQEIVISGGTGELTLTYSNNGDADNENYEAYIYDASTGGTELASISRIIQGDGVTPVTIGVDKTTIDESGTLAQRTVTFTIDLGSEYPDGTYEYNLVSVSGSLTDYDFETVFVTPFDGTIAITGGSGDVEIVVNDDHVRDGAESFRMYVREVGATAALASSPIVSVGAQSIPEYTLAAYDDAVGTTVISTQTESSNLYIGIDPVYADQLAETLYIELSGTGVGIFSETQKTAFVSGSSAPFGSNGEVITSFATNGDNGVYGEADRTVTATITVGGYASGSPIATIGTVNVTITDPVESVTWSLTADDTTPSTSTTSSAYDRTSGNETYWSWIEGTPTDLYVVYDEGTFIESGAGQSGYPQELGTPSSIIVGGVLYNQGAYQETVIDKSAVAEFYALEQIVSANTTVTFTVGGSSITNGTYYYRPNTFPTKSTSGVSAGSTFVPLSNTTGLTVGMSARATPGLSSSGVITSVGSTGVVMTSAVTTTIANGSLITFAVDDDWEWFNTPGEAFGSVTVSSNSGTFEVDLANKTGSKSFTFEIYENLDDASLVNVGATETITIQGIASTLSTDYQGAISFFASYVDASSQTLPPGNDLPGYIEFRNDGTVWGDVGGGPTTLSSFENIGNWISGSFNANDYRIRLDITDGPSGDHNGVVNSFGTWVNFSGSSSRIFGLNCIIPTTTALNLATMTVNITIENINDPSIVVTKTGVTFAVRVRNTELGDEDFFERGG